MHWARICTWFAVIVAALAFATAAGASPASTQTPHNFHASIDTGYGFGQGECCLFWYFGTPTSVNLPKVGPTTLTTFFIQCFSSFVCDPLNSQLTMTFQTKSGDQLVLLGYAPNLGTASNDGTSYQIGVEGVWTVQPTSTGKFASAEGSGTFSFLLSGTQASPSGSEHVTLDGTLKTK
jgi:hypothetical protein